MELVAAATTITTTTTTAAAAIPMEILMQIQSQNVGGLRQLIWPDNLSIRRREKSVYGRWLQHGF